jgi:hypothetical protein
LHTIRQRSWIDGRPNLHRAIRAAAGRKQKWVHLITHRPVASPRNHADDLIRHRPATSRSGEALPDRAAAWKILAGKHVVHNDRRRIGLGASAGWNLDRRGLVHRPERTAEQRE